MSCLVYLSFDKRFFWIMRGERNKREGGVRKEVRILTLLREVSDPSPVWFLPASLLHFRCFEVELKTSVLPLRFCTDSAVH